MKLKYYIGVFILSLFWACQKDFEITNITDMTLTIERDVFNDSIYKITNCNVTSSNDSILSYAKIKIFDNETNQVFWDGNWQDIRQSSFTLPARKDYSLTYELYREFNENRIIDFTINRLVNNHKIPKKFQLLSAEVDPSILGIEDLYGLNAEASQDYNMVIIADLSLEETNEEFEHNSETADYTFYQKPHTPRKISFTFNELYFDTKKIENTSAKWMHYAIKFYYPVDFVDSGNFSNTERTITFFINPRLKFENDEVDELIEYEIKNDPDWTSSGADYTGTLKIKWIYED